MKNFTKLLALLLALVIMLASCGVPGANETTGTESEVTTTETTANTTEETTEGETEEETTPYRDTISRTREELEAMLNLKDEDFDNTLAKLDEFEALAIVSSDLEAVDALYDEVEDMLYHISTQISIASVIYYINMKDQEASDRYLGAYEKYGDLYNEYIDACKNAYNNSPIRDELFADWSEEDIKQLLEYDPEIQELRQANEELQVQIENLNIYDKDNRAKFYAQLVTNQNRLAKLEGYDNYYVYASKEIYGRDYTMEDVAAFNSFVSKYMYENYATLNRGYFSGYRGLTADGQKQLDDFLNNEFDKLDENYFLEYIKSYEGTSTGEGFMHLLENRNMVFANGANSHQSAFQTYFDDLETPFCLFGSNGQSTNTMVHEMGHYYAAIHHPDVKSFDIAETQSQANEMLLVKFMQSKLDEDVFTVLQNYMVYNFVQTVLISSIIDAFEQRVYALDSVEGFGSEEFDAIMYDVCTAYGGVNFVNKNLTQIDYYWRMVCPSSSVYYISYATSVVESLGIYAVALEDEAEGREMYRKLIEDVTEEHGFKQAMEFIGLGDPFTEDTFIAIEGLLNPNK